MISFTIASFFTKQGKISHTEVNLLIQIHPVCQKTAENSKFDKVWISWLSVTYFLCVAYKKQIWMLDLYLLLSSRG